MLNAILAALGAKYAWLIESAAFMQIKTAVGALLSVVYLVSVPMAAGTLMWWWYEGTNTPITSTTEDRVYNTKQEQLLVISPKFELNKSITEYQYRVWVETLSGAYVRDVYVGVVSSPDTVLEPIVLPPLPKGTYRVKAVVKYLSNPITSATLDVDLGEVHVY